MRSEEKTMRKLFFKGGKRVLAGAVILSMSFSGTAWAGLNSDIPMNTQAEADVVLGDADKNGTVDLADANQALKHALGILAADAETISHADVDFNKKIDLVDASMILKTALGIKKFPTKEETLQAWGLGTNETKYVTQNRDYEWYIDQSTTGYASANNCGPSCTVMAAKWKNKDFAKTAADARDTAPRGGGWWYPDNILNFLLENGILCEPDSIVTEGEILKQLDEGNIMIMCLNTGGITFNRNLTQRTGKYYTVETGHFIVVKGYRIVDNKTYLEVYDPLHCKYVYADGTLKGKDRYYLAEEVINSVLYWWPSFLVVLK